MPHIKWTVSMVTSMFVRGFPPPPPPPNPNKTLANAAKTTKHTCHVSMCCSNKFIHCMYALWHL